MSATGVALVMRAVVTWGLPDCALVATRISFPMLSTMTLPLAAGAPDVARPNCAVASTGERPLLCSTGAHMLDGYWETYAVAPETRTCAAIASATTELLRGLPWSVYARSI